MFVVKTSTYKLVKRLGLVGNQTLTIAMSGHIRLSNQWVRFLVKPYCFLSFFFLLHNLVI